VNPNYTRKEKENKRKKRKEVAVEAQNDRRGVHGSIPRHREPMYS
jgi:hypothetical protein